MTKMARIELNQRQFPLSKWEIGIPNHWIFCHENVNISSTIIHWALMMSTNKRNFIVNNNWNLLNSKIKIDSHQTISKFESLWIRRKKRFATDSYIYCLETKMDSFFYFLCLILSIKLRWIKTWKSFSHVWQFLFAFIVMNFRILYS